MNTARRPAIGFVLATLFLDVLGIGLVIPVLPQLVVSFRAGDVSSAASVQGLLVSLYCLMQFLFAPLLGSLSDRFGRRPVLLGSLFGSGLDYLLLAWAPSLPWFFVGRLVSGITGASFSTASAYIADVTPPEKRAQGFGLIGAAFGLGFIVGPAAGGLLGDLNLRLPFIVAAGLTLLNWLYGLLVVPESLPRESRRAFRWERANPVGSLLALRRYPVLLGLTATMFLIHLAHGALPSTWVLYTSYRYQWGPDEVGWSLALIGVMAALVQGGLVRLVVPRIGEERAVLLGFSIAALNYLAYGLATQGWMVYVVLVLGSVGGIGGPAVQSLISRGVPANEQGAMQGAVSSLTSVAGILGPLIATNLFGFFIGPRAPVHLPGAAFFMSALLVAAGLVLALRSLGRLQTAPAGLEAQAER